MRRLFCTLLALWLPVAASGADTRSVARGYTLVPGRFVQGQQPDGNSVLIETSDGLVVFDTGRHPAHTQRLLDAATEQREPIIAVINSHWHLDHVGGNLMIRKAYPEAQVHASGAIDGALTGFLANYKKQLTELLGRAADGSPDQAAYRAELALIDNGEGLKPTHVVTRSHTVTIGEHELRLNLERNAVTGGDIWLFDRKTRTLLAGDLVTLPAPLLDTACPQRWQRALGHFAETTFRQLVPGHGPVMDRDEFDQYRTALDHFLTCGSSTAAKQQCIDGWLADTRGLIPDQDKKLAEGLLDYYVDSVLRGDPKRLAERCGATQPVAPPAGE
ncbi:MBL fold metallo-hydrolase [Tahibacter amnicola]|uniref:MBL fold metallo-hydrolase n=1 Tax=Tahibacter amnicola TaxID=2976241 RepID=A0ABY6BLN5_9GAMM|nr:MBL fold metallo-hydrolase [Tahibacter amnicola]UXI70387.1 MBL fold metallo-hydrolase [Tahibacter amnicola]